jgi:hypothetical protein
MTQVLQCGRGSPLRLVLRCGVGRSTCIARKTALCAERGAVAIYDIRIAGHLDTNWAEWFDGLTITNLDNGTTQLSGDLVDQAALHGTLNKVRDLNLTLVSVTSLESPTGHGPDQVDFTLPPERVTATTDSGAVTLRLPAGDGPYRVATHSGSGEEDVQVPTDPASSRRIDVSSSSGDVHVLPQ